MRDLFLPWASNRGQVTTLTIHSQQRVCMCLLSTQAHTLLPTHPETASPFPCCGWIVVAGLSVCGVNMALGSLHRSQMHPPSSPQGSVHWKAVVQKVLSQCSASAENHTKQKWIFVAQSHTKGTALCSEKFQVGDRSSHFHETSINLICCCIWQRT